MFHNYLKVAFRNLARYKGYSFINIAGLATGIASCLLISLWIQDELSYDNYHRDPDRIFRVAARSQSPTDESQSARISAPVTAVLREHFPQVEKAAMAIGVSDGLVNHEGLSGYEGRFFADNELFDILTIPFLAGDRSTALAEPYTLVLTRQLAEKYFGSIDVVGETLNINRRDYRIAGVVQDPPANTHFKYGLLLSLRTFDGRYPFDAWFLGNMLTYVKLRPGVDRAALDEQLRQLVKNYAGEGALEPGETYEYFLQPVKDIHLHSHLRQEVEPPGSVQYLIIFGAVALLIIIIAGLNFANLTTARSTTRAREVGMRKVVGAGRLQLATQFMGETLITAVLALLLALTLVELAAPYVSALSGKALNLDSLMNARGIAALGAGLLVLVATAGVYPALILSSFSPALTLKSSQGSSSSKNHVQRMLVVGQFIISAFLIIGTLTIYEQLDFMKGRDLGFTKEQKLVIPFRGGATLRDNYEQVKASFADLAAVTGLTASSNTPGQKRMGRWDTELSTSQSSISVPVNFYYVDFDFLPEYDIDVIAGRPFNREIASDVEGAYLLNAAAVAKFGWQSPIEALGNRLSAIDEGVIIGVVDDFHYLGLQSIIEPMILQVRPSMFAVLTLTLEPGNLSATLAALQSKWQDFYPDSPFEYYFLDEYFQRQYISEEQIGSLLGLFTGLGLLIACAGLVGLASFSAQRRTKEIGIRKVLGATVSQIVALLSREFLLLVLGANFIAWPLAYYVVNRWLEQFAYHMDLGLGMFLATGILTLVIALVTVGYQAIKAATANPVDAIRYE
ncbi:MAG: ABC transporter permease [Candidatus Neomarinimicrobiota bacterium]